jgi:hypothetical protein
MRATQFFLMTAILMGPATAADAQDFGVLESAETINRGNFKLAAYPLFALPDRGDSQFSLPVALGYGFTDSFDMEARAAFSDDVTFLGGDGEYWFIKNRPLDLSLRGGVHVGMVDGEVGDSVGVDVTVIGSAPVASRLELVGALDMAFNSVDLGATRDGFTTVHLVPGVEIAVTPDLDFLAEFGVGVTDSSTNYVAFGLAFYVR